MAPDARPPFPSPPPGTPRLTHRPTVLAGLLYWRSALDHARRDAPARRTAAILEGIYLEALLRLGEDDPDTPSEPVCRACYSPRTADDEC